MPEFSVYGIDLPEEYWEAQRKKYFDYFTKVIDAYFSNPDEDYDNDKLIELLAEIGESICGETQRRILIRSLIKTEQ